MRKFLFAILCALSLNANAVLVEATHNLDGATLDFTYDPNDPWGFPQTLYLEFDATDFFPGYEIVSYNPDNPYFSWVGDVYLRWDMVLDFENSNFNVPLSFDFHVSGLFTGMLPVITPTKPEELTFWSQGQYGLFETVGFGNSTVRMNLSKLWYSDGVNYLPSNEMDGATLKFGQGNRIFVGSSAVAVGVDEPPTALIAALMLGLLVYRGNRLNR